MRELVAQNPNIDADTLARKLLDEINLTDVLPLIVDEIKHIQRAVTHQHERAAMIARLHRTHHRQDAAQVEKISKMVAANNARVRELLRRQWQLGDGNAVNIGEATLDQIRQRLAMLRKQRAGLSDTIGYLEAIEAELVRTGANCLNDLLGATVEG
jgi:Mg2+ and Co2+ transporter CorA